MGPFFVLPVGVGVTVAVALPAVSVLLDYSPAQLNVDGPVPRLARRCSEDGVSPRSLDRPDCPSPALRGNVLNHTRCTMSSARSSYVPQ